MLADLGLNRIGLRGVLDDALTLLLLLHYAPRRDSFLDIELSKRSLLGYLQISILCCLRRVVVSLLQLSVRPNANAVEGDVSWSRLLESLVLVDDFRTVAHLRLPLSRWCLANLSNVLRTPERHQDVGWVVLQYLLNLVD